MEEATKCCFKCGETKSLSAFYKHPKMPDGYLNKCKECHKRDITENRNKNLEYYRNYDRNRKNQSQRVSKQNKKTKERYANDVDFKKSILETKERWLQTNKDKRLAHGAVSNATRDGELHKPSVCSCCGDSPETIYGHHWSYEESNWLDVMWLCSKCHGKEHKRINDCKRKGVQEYADIQNAEEALQLLLDYVKLTTR